MVSTTTVLPPQLPVDEPTWEIAQLFPAQGQWSEEEYLALETNHLVEFSHGLLEFPPMPTPKHQFTLSLLLRLLDGFVTAHNLGVVLPASLRVRLWPGKIREPDLVFVLTENFDRFDERFCDGADLVVEVVSGSAQDRRRDLVTKRREYERAGISEYWLVDPQEESITVLHLVDDAYVEHGVFRRGERATSVLLAGFEADVADVLDAGPMSHGSRM